MAATVNDCSGPWSSAPRVPQRETSLTVCGQGATPPRSPWSREASSLLRAGLPAVRFGCCRGLIRLGPDRFPAPGPDSPQHRARTRQRKRGSGTRHGGARRITRNSPSRSLQVEKGTYGETTSLPQKRPGARPVKGADLKRLPFAVTRRVPPARRGSRAFGLPTVTAAARRRPGRPAQPGPGLLTRDRFPDDNTHLMKLVSST